MHGAVIVVQKIVRATKMRSRVRKGSMLYRRDCATISLSTSVSPKFFSWSHTIRKSCGWRGYGIGREGASLCTRLSSDFPTILPLRQLPRFAAVATTTSSWLLWCHCRGRVLLLLLRPRFPVAEMSNAAVKKNAFFPPPPFASRKLHVA